MNDKIDFVLTWVDGNDLDWQKSMHAWRGDDVTNSSSANRFRDWGLLKYWFRSVEKNAPWVNRIFFVTCGQRPEWLNTEHPKLVLADHRDYMPQEYLPTFNSSTIEMNLFRIPGLSERFVNFNDDFLLTAPVTAEDFFRKGKALEPAVFSVISPESSRDIFPHCLVNVIGIINQHFSKRQVLKKHFRTFYSLKYGKSLLQNLYLTPASVFTGFKDAHLPSPYFKSCFEEVWSAEPAFLDRASRNRFRSHEDVNEWLVKYWQMCSGKTAPRSTAWGRCYQLGRDTGYLEAIRKQTYHAVCLNDTYVDGEQFESVRQELEECLEAVFPEKSSFEL